jgi:ubiquitin-protein ligase
MQTNTQRIIKEIEEIKKNPDNFFIVSISQDNIMDWYIKYQNLNDERFTDGSYILHIKLHEGYPFKAPDFKWLTPNGRFEVNSRICYNISTYHEGEWNPLWRMRQIIIGILSMFLDSNTTGIGHIQNTSIKQFQQHALNSKEINNSLITKYNLEF